MTVAITHGHTSMPKLAKTRDHVGFISAFWANSWIHGHKISTGKLVQNKTDLSTHKYRPGGFEGCPGGCCGCGCALPLGCGGCVAGTGVFLGGSGAKASICDGFAPATTVTAARRLLECLHYKAEQAE